MKDDKKEKAFFVSCIVALMNTILLFRIITLYGWVYVSDDFVKRTICLGIAAELYFILIQKLYYLVGKIVIKSNNKK